VLLFRRQGQARAEQTRTDGTVERGRTCLGPDLDDLGRSGRPGRPDLDVERFRGVKLALDRDCRACQQLIVSTSGYCSTISRRRPK
jgi:hypothetical protein